MPRKEKDYGAYQVRWLPEENRFEIKQKYKNSTTTVRFGLGNALISFNLSNPPEELTVPITDETSGVGLLPTSPFGMMEWFVEMSAMSKKTKRITGFKGWEFDVNYYEASGLKVKEAKGGGEITVHGWGAQKVYPHHRVES